ncbi:hypothetical protein HY480_01095 [Candidatus Uhrbacteria bacterium]|nr:hypothetical protein [Candidatus Uhrbacteria bacterium]
MHNIRYALFAVVATAVVAGCNPQIDVHMPPQEPLVDDETVQWFVDQAIARGTVAPVLTDTAPATPTHEAPATPVEDVVEDVPEATTTTESAPPETTPTTEPEAPVEEPAPPAEAAEPTPMEDPEPAQDTEPVTCMDRIGIDGDFTPRDAVVAGMEFTDAMHLTLNGVCESRAITYLRIGFYRIPPQGNVSEMQDICDVFSCDCTVHECGPMGAFNIVDHTGNSVWLSPGLSPAQGPGMYFGMPFRPNTPNQPIEIRAHERLDLTVVGTIREDAPAGTYQFALLDMQEMKPSGYHDFRQIGLAWPEFTIHNESVAVPTCSGVPNLTTALPFNATTYVNPDGEFRVLDLTAIAPCDLDAWWNSIEVAFYREFEDGSFVLEAFCDVFRCDDNGRALRFTDETGNAIDVTGSWEEMRTRIVGTPYRTNPYEVPIPIAMGNALRLQAHVELRDDAPPGTYVVSLQTVVIDYGANSSWAYNARTQLGPTVIVSE